jgi:hypothetical protein
MILKCPLLKNTGLLDVPVLRCLISVQEQLKEEGRVRFTGVSCHGSAHFADPEKTIDKVLLAAVDDGRFDVFMMTYNFMNAPLADPVLDACNTKGIGNAESDVIYVSMHVRIIFLSAPSCVFIIISRKKGIRNALWNFTLSLATPGRKYARHVPVTAKMPAHLVWRPKVCWLWHIKIWSLGFNIKIFMMHSAGDSL